MKRYRASFYQGGKKLLPAALADITIQATYVCLKSIIERTQGQESHRIKHQLVCVFKIQSPEIYVIKKEGIDNIKKFFYCCFHFHLCSASKDPIEQRKAINSGRKFLSKAAFGIFAFLANDCKRFGTFYNLQKSEEVSK